MNPVFLVTVFLCLLVTGVVASYLNVYILAAPANVDAVALGATCTPTDGTQSNCDDVNAICPSTGTAECQCKPGYSAYSGACEIKAGAACTAPTTNCVSQSTCSTTCSCNNGYFATSTGTCTVIAQGKVNAACDTTRVCTGTNVVCTEGFCTCKESFSGNKGDDDCTSNKGVALGQVSVWTLCMTILTMSLAVNVV